jgi:rhodanese-related sulfurtransferase
MTVETISLDELRRRLEGSDALVLVDALAPMVFAHSHLPGAINLPPSGLDEFVVGRRIPDRWSEIVVYCSSADCNDSVETAEGLKALGYANVRRYAGGKNEWREAGLPLERAGRPYVPR